MPPEPPAHLPPDVVLQLASILKIEDEAFVVGGQALNLWAERYVPKTGQLALFGPFTSKDLDYFGHGKAAALLAEALGGRVELPIAFEDATPQTAIVVAEVEGREVRIDFLSHVIGVRNPQRLVTEILVPFETNGVGGEFAIPVMHPLHCLQSRVANILHLKRSDPVAMRQLAAAPVVLREYIEEVLSVGSSREAVRTLQGLFKYLRRDELGKRAHKILPGTDPLDVIAHFAADERLDERYRKKNIARMLAEISRGRVAVVRSGK